MSLFASLALPIGRNSATAQTWEVASPHGTQVAFDRRDDQGRIHYQARMVLADGRAMRASYYAADCSKGLLHGYNWATKQWETPLRVTDGAIDGEGTISIGSTAGVAYKYACAKYGR